jgi:hypothetical protein
MMEAHDAWILMAGIIIGLFLAAGAVAWAVHYLKGVVEEAREVIKEMGKVVNQAKVLAYHVSENYAPLRKKVDEIEREVNDIRTLLSTERG